MDFSQDSKVIFAPHWATKTEGVNGSIALVKSSVLPEPIIRRCMLLFHGGLLHILLSLRLKASVVNACQD
jgi:hypothetical protein